MADPGERPWIDPGPGTPGGRLLRRAWQPVVRACDLPPGRALRLRLLGESLVAFRTRSGEVGLLEAACPHAGTFLDLGTVEAGTIRCLHHGWRFDPRGRPLAGRHPARALPVREALGLVFAWLGPGPPPPLPGWSGFAGAPGVRPLPPETWPVDFFSRLENTLDVAHVAAAHRGSGLAAHLPDGTEPAVRRRPWGLTVEIRTPPGAPTLPSVHLVLPNLLVMFAPVEGLAGWHPHLAWRVPRDAATSVSFLVARLPRPEPPPPPREQPFAWATAVVQARRVLAGEATLDALAGHPNLTEIEDCVALAGRPPPPARPDRREGPEDAPVRALRARWREAAAADGGPLDQEGPASDELRPWGEGAP